MSVVQSGGLRMEIGVLYLFHAMLVLAELIVCSARELACILAKWFWPTVMSRDITGFVKGVQNAQFSFRTSLKISTTLKARISGTETDTN